MSEFIREKYEEVELQPGQGKISATISIGIGFLSLLGAFCFLFPELFTTPEARAFYNADVLRIGLHISILISVGFGLVSMWRHENSYYGLTGMAIACLAAVLGSGRIEAPTLETRSFYLGFDYFILTLVVLAAVFIPMERAFAKVPQQKILRKGWTADMKYFMFSHIGIQLISFLTVIPVQVFLINVSTWSFQETIRSQPLWLQFIELLAVVDIGTYWIHRAMHEIPAFWKIHAVHHSSEQMDWLASSRLHVIEVLVNRFAGFLPIFILGFSPSALYAYLVFISFHAIFIHANVRFRFPFLRWVIATPEFHHWHHSSEQAAIDKNYAAFLPIYDWIFRTHYMPDRLASVYGTVAKDVPDGIVKQFLFPFKAWFGGKSVE